MNPSNMIAARTKPGMMMFPNLARPNEEQYWDDVDKCCRAELEAAGIPIIEADFLRHNREVPTKVIGEAWMWGFRRAWYYWVCEGPGIPPDLAMALHATHGTQCRVLGGAGCDSPLDACRGFAVGCYHVDTYQGLKALAEVLRSIYVARPGDEGEAKT